MTALSERFAVSATDWTFEMGSFSIRSQLVKLIIAVVTPLWILGVVIAGLGLRHEVTEIFDSALRETADHLIPIIRELKQLPAAGEEPFMANYSATRGKVHYVVRSGAGDILIAAKGAPIQPNLLPMKAGFETVGNLRIFTRLVEPDGLWINVVQEMQERAEAARDLWLGLASPLLALLPLAAFGISWSIRRATEPIAIMARELEARSSNDLTAIADDKMPTELVPISTSINKLLLRIKSALDAEREFSSNVAHELRNPIAGARAQLQLLSAKLRGTPDSEQVGTVLSQLDRVSRRAEKLLQISRAEAGAGQSGEHAELSTIATLIIDEFRGLDGIAQRLKIDVDDDASSFVPMDMDALAIVLRNAIENAVLHGSATEPIVVRIGADRTVHVINGCGVIPANILDRLKSRFRRAERASVAGNGIGLTIIETIMTRAGGAVELHSPAIGTTTGFQLVLRFPEA